MRKYTTLAVLLAACGTYDPLGDATPDEARALEAAIAACAA